MEITFAFPLCFLAKQLEGKHLVARIFDHDVNAVRIRWQDAVEKRFPVDK